MANSAYYFCEMTSPHGSCPMIVDFKQRSVHLPERSRGTIARTYLYMSDRYNIKLSKSQDRLMKVWNKTYTVSHWECKRNGKIRMTQGWSNRFVSSECG
jgi:deoxyribonuclease-1